MGTIKRFTLRFDTNNPREAEAARHLEKKSGELGVSQNSMLQQLILADMDGDSEENDTDDISGIIADRVVDKIVGLLAGASGEALAGLSGRLASQRAESDINTEEPLSDDAMDFLSSF